MINARPSWASVGAGLRASRECKDFGRAFERGPPGWSLVATIVASLLVGAVSPALAYPLHVFSWATEQSEGPGYIGLKEGRLIVDVDFTTCSVVYQTMWATTTEPNEFVELATSHKCDGVRTLLGHGSRGVWYQVLEIPSPATGFHRYRIEQNQSNNAWRFYMDGMTFLAMVSTPIRADPPAA